MDRETLKQATLFRAMSQEEIGHALTMLKQEELDFSKGEIILRAGETTERMGLVLQGSVTVESNDLWGNRTILSHVGEGEFFAETYALLPGEVMLVDAVANEDCRILFLRVGGLLDLPHTANGWLPKLVVNLLTISTHKNLTLSGRSFHTSPKSARGRIMAYLNTVSLQKRSKEFDIPFDRQQLADYLNLDRSAMSKELGRMRDDGLIQSRKGHFVLLT